MAAVGERGDQKLYEQMTAVQKKTFTRWMNHFLVERLLKVNDLFVDLKDGKLLINLLELISSKTLKAWNKAPKMTLHELQNINIALDFVKEEGLKIVNIDANDINQGNPKLILGLIWTLILRYQINMGGDGASPKQELLDWVNKQIKPYEHIPQAKDFTGSWQDGKVLAALVDSLKPGVMDTKGLSDPMKDTQQAMNVAEKEYQIPQLVDAVDMVHHPDEHSNMTYIACFRDYLENKAKHREQYKIKGPFPGKCFAKGKGVEGGFARRPLPFTIHSRTAGDQPVVGKWIRPMEVKVTGPDGDIPCEVRDNQDGTFFAKYVAPKSGDYKVAIQVVPEPMDEAPKSHIQGSVYHLTVREPGDAKMSWAEGPGLERAFDDKPAVFTVHCHDKDNKPVPGDNVEVKVEQIEAPAGATSLGDKVPCEVKDNGDGTYAVKYHPSVPGKYRILATVSGDPIRAMPVVVQCFKSADPKQTIAKGPGVTSGEPRVGIEAPFAVLVKDGKGNPVPTGGHDIKVTVTGPSGPVPVDVKDDGTGVYKVAYTPQAAGDHVVDVKLNGTEIKDAPFKVAIKKPADPAKSYAEGPGLHKAWDNKPNVFKVHALDEDGKPVSGEPVTVTVTPKDGKGSGASVPVTVKDNGDGTYDVAYNTDKPGDYVIDARIRDKPIKEMPKDVRCYKGVDPTKSIVEGPGVTSGFAGRDLPFIVKTIDKDGHPVKTGGADIIAKVLGPNKVPVPCELKDNGDGTYSGSYKPVIPGDHRVMIILDQEHPVGKSPYICKVKPGASPSQSFAVGRGWKEGYDCLPTLFTIYAKDDNGQPVSGEKIRVVMKKVTPPAEQKALDEEIAKMDDFLKAKKAKKVKEIEEERKKKQAEAEKKAGEEGKGAGATWTDPEGDVAVEVRDNGDGSYRAEYCAPHPGKYEIAVTISDVGLHIKESPKLVPIHLSKPKIVFWKHTYNQEKQELEALKKKVQEYESILQKHNLI